MKHKRRRAIIRQLHKRYRKAMKEAEQRDELWEMLDLFIELLHKVGKVRR